MGLFSRLMGRETKAASSIEDLLREKLLLAGTKSGVPVTWQTALECSIVLACATVKANGLAQVPFKVFKADGAIRLPATDHKLYDLLSIAPNDFQTSFEFRQEIGLHLTLTGNAYVWTPRANGRITELLPLDPGAVTVSRNGWEPTYTVTLKDASQVTVAAADMWHLKWLPWAGVEGMDGVKLAREAIGLAVATETHGGLLFRNGAQPKGMLSTEQMLKEDQRKILRDSWQEAHSGENKFGTAVMFGGMKYSLVGYPNDQAQFLETRRHQVEEVCRAFGVMPIMVGHSDKASTYASAEQMFLHHAVHCLGPLYSCVESSATRWLLSEKDRRAGYYCRFNANGLMRGSSQDRAAYYSKALGAGGSPAWMTQDEIRELEEMNPMGGNAALLREPSNVGSKVDSVTEGADDGQD